ncbi:MAG: UDP-N-acetylmuramoyl-tripeptide--D-alanyl-D-alanine ligase [Bacteroidetes bacterium]|nr:UDP-N-acetylmuramoyl-tripeptide--D-alanyl-D-alanine ligase [Bacteroidota bacterium]MCL5027125.1 UDP-N-acetylmuramoyl-tripeptide--D-alanyl-D-alanine ligase [Chloroflexota bacterium]
MIFLAQVREGIGAHRLAFETSATMQFTGVVHDSRQAVPGSLFVALRGESADGHQFIPDAVRRGATGVIAEREPGAGWLPAGESSRLAYLIVPDALRALQDLAHYWRRRHAIRVIAVTGSVGKTTTREMIAAVLSRRFQVLRSEANLNTETGLPLTLLKLEAIHQRAVLEMGMYGPGEIAALCRIAEPDTGVVTNVGPTHLERLGSLERIAEAKGELPRSLSSAGWAVLNGDDPRVRDMPTPARRLLFGLGEDCEVRADELESLGLAGICFRLHLGERSISVSSALMGRHQVYACLAAAAVGMVEGMSPEDIAMGLASPPPALRLRVVPGPNGSHLIDDTYNAAPVSVHAALDLLSDLPGRRVAVLGDMLELGPYEESAHREVGRWAAAVLDRLVVVGERARLIGEEARASGMASVQFAATKDEVELEFGPVDWVLIKGSRGMKMEDLVARWQQPEEGGRRQ